MIPEGMRLEKNIIVIFLELYLVQTLAFKMTTAKFIPFCRREEFMRWMEKLPDSQTPSWLGLPNNAETVILQTKATGFIQKLLKMQSVTEDEDLAYQEYVVLHFVP